MSDQLGTDLSSNKISNLNQEDNQSVLNLPIEAANSSYFDYQQTIDQPTKPWFSMMFLLFVLLVVFLIWAVFSEISESVRSQGQFIPSERTQIVQVADGGVLSELKVGEGDIVKKGQILAVLEQGRASAALEESRAKLASLQCRLIRARAEVQGVQPDFSSVSKDHQQFVVAQQGVYDQKKLGLDSELATLRGNLEMAQEEKEMNQSLFNTGDVSRLDVMRSERQLFDFQGKITQLKNVYRQTAQKEASEVETEHATAQFKLEERQIMFDHTQLVAPVTGVVKFLEINTLGGVLRAGDELMQISPTDSEMLIELKLNPVDVGQLKIEMPVIVKLDAFDFSIYGSLKGQLSYISSDTLTEKNGGQNSTYYLAQVRILGPELQSKNRLSHQLLKQGMTVSIDIQTGKRTIFEYLAKPIIRAFAGALNER